MGLELTEFGESLFVFLVYSAGVYALWRLFTSDFYRRKMAWFYDGPEGADDEDGPMITTSYSDRLGAIVGFLSLLFLVIAFLGLFVIDSQFAVVP